MSIQVEMAPVCLKHINYLIGVHLVANASCRQIINRYGANISRFKSQVTISKKSVSPSAIVAFVFCIASL